MLEKIIRWSIDNRFFVLLATGFLAAWGAWSLATTPVDAIPDLSDVQVIIFTDYAGQGPQIVEDQVTYPLTTQMLAVPFAKAVRGYSFFGFSLVYIIFEDGTDLYWARSRVLEYLNYVAGRMPEGVTPQIGPDATGVGWILEYALTSKTHDLQQLRSIQDWFLRYELTSVEGVSEVASVGGYVKQYQVTVDPNRLDAYDLSLAHIRHAIRRSNNDVGGRLMELGETEFIVRGLGYIKSLEDLRLVTIGSSPDGTPIRLSDVADIALGPELRRGLVELNGEGEVVGGIVIGRWGANALETIEGVKAKLEELRAGLPDDVEITFVYDRSSLIHRAVETLQEKLLEESIVVAIVCAIFLFHLRSSLVAILTLPIGILMAFGVMRMQGINANIMSLGGIAIAIGAMIDAAIIMIENAHKHLERDRGKKPHWQIIADASVEVGPTLFFSLLVITLSFLPIFTLEAQEGRMFKPLAFTKTYAMAASALLAITLTPVLMGYFIRGRIPPEEANPLNRILIRIYHPILRLLFKGRWLVLVAAVALVAVTWVPFKRLGSEFMPPLWEGDLLYMPTTLPGISITKAREVLQQTDKIIKTFPEVHHVFGKIGRAETATDPAPLTMIETTIMLKPEDEWRTKPREGLDAWFHGHLPGFLRGGYEYFSPTPRISVAELTRELDRAIQFPGLTNAWTMPIKTRIDMLATGIKTPVGIKIAGADLNVLQDLGEQVEALIRTVPDTLSVYAERVMGGNYLDIEIDRSEVARHGLTVGDVQDVIQSAIGGMNVTWTVEGLERYPINVRYARELRDSPEALRRVLIRTPGGAQVPLGQLATLRFAKGPPGIKSENSRPNVWIYIDIENIDVGTYVERAQLAVAENITLPPGYSLAWSGQYEYMQRAQQRLLLVVPFTLAIIFVLIYLNTRSVFKTLVVLSAIPFSLVGAVWMLYLLDYNLSIAVWVGMIALAGLSAETGVVMLLYLDVAFEEWKQKGKMNTLDDLREAIDHGAVQRLRPKMMTVCVIVAGLLPIMWGHGTGSDVMKRIATPMVGGVLTSFIVVLGVYPVVYYMWRSREIRRQTEHSHG